MEKLNKIVYLIIIFFLSGLGVHKYLNGRIVAGLVQLVLNLLVIGLVIDLIEFFYVIFKIHRDENGEIEIPKGFFDFL